MDKEKEQLVLEHIKFAEDVANYRWSTLKNRYSKDEIISCAYMSLVNAAKKYIPNKKATFKTYANKCINRAITKEVNSDKKYNVKNGVKHELPIISLNDNSNDLQVGYIDLVQAKEDCFEDLLINYEIEKLLSCLDHKERELIDMYYFQCLTHEEIAQILKVHRTTVTKALKKIIEKIKGCLTTGK